MVKGSLHRLAIAAKCAFTTGSNVVVAFAAMCMDAASTSVVYGYVGAETTLTYLGAAIGAT